MVHKFFFKLLNCLVWINTIILTHYSALPH